MKKEIWKPVVITKYEVSNLGRVRNIETGKILNQIKDWEGYLHVSSNMSVHRLVAKAFLPNIKPVVNHKDGNKQNNNVDKDALRLLAAPEAGL